MRKNQMNFEELLMLTIFLAGLLFSCKGAYNNGNSANESKLLGKIDSLQMQLDSLRTSQKTSPNIEGSTESEKDLVVAPASSRPSASKYKTIGQMFKSVFAACSTIEEVIGVQ